MVMGACFVVIVAGMKVSSPILVPVLLSFFIATISAPPLLWLTKKGLPTFVALLAVIAIITAVGAVMVALISASLADFQEQLPHYESRLREFYALALEHLAVFGIGLDMFKLDSVLSPASIAAAVGAIANDVGNVVAKAFLIFLVVIFILFEISAFQNKLEKIFDRENGSMERLNNLRRNIQEYLVIKTITSLGTGVAVWILLTALGVDFAILFALLAFMLNFVPNIGSLIAALPAIILALLQLGVATAVYASIGYVVINVLIGSILEPRMSGRKLGLSPLVVFLSLIFWGWVMGPVGMFLSVPLTMMVRLVAEINDNTRWLAVLLSERGDTAPVISER